MKFLANENIPLASINYLELHDFGIKSIGQGSFGISDEEVMKIAVDEECCIIMYDSDYGELIFRHGYQPQCGVIFIRLPPTDPEQAGRIIKDLIKNEQIKLERALTVIDSNSIRQKKY
ncbi:DUF5615 family PIN-like protein [Marinoscillum sp.]|uniref:DUF5615 family PIN-like protein n=1 Tax=Marinoscillum sp. TaxID=2024838 RepID=UPI003BA8E7C5